MIGVLSLIACETFGILFSVHFYIWDNIFYKFILSVKPRVFNITSPLLSQFDKKMYKEQMCYSICMKL